MRMIMMAGLLALVACAETAPPAPEAQASPSQAASARDDAAGHGTARDDARPGDAERDAAAPIDPAQTVAASADVPATATLRGRVAYPSEELPAMRVCALAAADPGTAHCTGTAVNQAHYELVLPAGDWWLLAWPLGTGTAGDPGLLSAASECLGSGGIGCDDHALRPVQVAAGEMREGLDINDWYYDPAEFPPPMAPADD